MVRRQLDERRWQKIRAVLRAKRGAGRPGKDDRNFIEAVLWWRRTGVPWRDLPVEFGSWKTVFNRFDRWAKHLTARGSATERRLSGLEYFPAPSAMFNTIDKDARVN
jgi:transposase